MTTLSRPVTRQVLVILVATLLTAGFGILRVEPVAASGGCCGQLGCNLLYETCNGDPECSSGYECCIGGCL